MSGTKTTCTVGVLAAALAAALAAGCSPAYKSSSADKAGGSQAPTVLRLADSDATEQPDTPTVQYFAAQVAKLSGGKLRVHIVFQAAGEKTPNVEVRVAQMVRDGKSDLGWIGARAWDERGVKSFQALQAPFLITSYALLDRVASSPMADEMLAGLKPQNVVGLALVPELLRHPVGIQHPLKSLADFKGARVRIQPSRATAAFMRALGAVPDPVSNSNIAYAIGHHQIDGEELSLGNANTSFVTANITFFGKALTLFANRHSYDQLSDQQRRVLQAAAERTLRHVVANPPSESALARRFCKQIEGGRIALADRRDIAALARAAQPVYRQLERDPQTRTYIARIRELKATTPADRPLIVPPVCNRPQSKAPPATGPPRPASILNGTYHLLFTRADTLAFWGAANRPDLKGLPSVETRILNDGRFLWGSGNGLRGTYSIRGDRITFVAPAYGTTRSFTFSLDRNGTLRLRPVLPMDRGDQWVTAGEPWLRVGPPRSIP